VVVASIIIVKRMTNHECKQTKLEINSIILLIFELLNQELTGSTTVLKIILLAIFRLIIFLNRVILGI
jgi:hypothetical protein